MDLLSELANQFADIHPDEAAQILEKMSLHDVSDYLMNLSPQSAAKVLGQMLPASGGAILADLPIETRNLFLDNLPHSTAALLLRSMDPTQQMAVLESLSVKLSNVLRLLLVYPAETAGALMDPRVSAWPKDMKAAEAMDRMRIMPQRMVDYLYIVNRNNELIGVMSYWELTVAESDRSLASLMHPHVDHLLATATKQSILAQPAWRRFHSMPVTDEHSNFVGVIRYKTLRQLEGEAVPELQNPIHTFLALGELCWTGMTAVWDAMTTVTTPIGRNAKKS